MLSNILIYDVKGTIDPEYKKYLPQATPTSNLESSKIPAAAKMPEKDAGYELQSDAESLDPLMVDIFERKVHCTGGPSRMSMVMSSNLTPSSCSILKCWAATSSSSPTHDMVNLNKYNDVKELVEIWSSIGTTHHKLI